MKKVPGVVKIQSFGGVEACYLPRALVSDLALSPQDLIIFFKSESKGLWRLLKISGEEMNALAEIPASEGCVMQKDVTKLLNRKEESV